MSKNDELIDRISKKHGVEPDAVSTAFEALKRGNGTMAQFSHQAFGGMAQWSKGGMSMVGDMFNTDMKAKLDGVLSDLSAAMADGSAGQASDEGSSKHDGQNGSSQRGASQGGSSNWWPSDLGSPSSSGSQNDMRYAFFPDKQRLVVEDGGARRVYDTGDHRISGVSQQQSGSRSVSFQSQNGAVNLDELKTVQ